MHAEPPSASRDPSLAPGSTTRPLRLLADLQDFYWLSARGLAGIFRRPFYLREMLEQMEYGAASWPIVALVTIFIGMALSLQLAVELTAFGLKMYTGRVVGISIIREVGPVVTAMVYAGRAGSGIASELGMMVLGQQVDSLRVFGVDPVKKLVTPRLVAAILIVPALTIIGDAIAIAGGWFIAVYVTDQSGFFFWSSMRKVLDFNNIFSGIFKPFVFGAIIASVSCYKGLSTRGGAAGLRRSTTSAVVLSITLIFVADYAMTRVLLSILGYPVQ